MLFLIYHVQGSMDHGPCTKAFGLLFHFLITWNMEP